jgi:hypothetical protein
VCFIGGKVWLHAGGLKIKSLFTLDILALTLPYLTYIHLFFYTLALQEIKIALFMYEERKIWDKLCTQLLLLTMFYLEHENFTFKHFLLFALQ